MEKRSLTSELKRRNKSDVVDVCLLRVGRCLRMLHYAVNAEHCAKECHCFPLQGVKLQWFKDKDNSVLKTERKGRTRRSEGE